MKIGIVGYQGSGRSSLFHWLTEKEPDLSLSHKGQMDHATVPDERIAQLCDIYKPKKITVAQLEIVDTPGLSRDHEGSAAKLAMIREAGCLVVVIAGFGGNDPAADLSSFEDDLLIADLDIVSNRIERIKDQVRKPRPNRDELLKELELLEPMKELLDEGRALRELELNVEQEKAVRSFQLFTLKPRMVILNVTDDESGDDKFQSLAPEGTQLFAIPLSLQVELLGMSPEERNEFCEEMEVSAFDRDTLIRTIMDVSGQMTFFTAGEKEVRTWMIPKGCTAVEAAGNIHTDLAKGFIRAETMTVDDLLRCGSEREIKAQNLLRREHREYVIQDGDIINIQHN